MKSNKKDVNDYFKYLRLYYVELLKKQKKEEQKNKRKKVIIDNEDEDDDDVNVFEKDTTNRKKIVRIANLKDKTKKVQGIDEKDIKEPNRTKITKKIEDEIVKRNDIKKQKKKKEEEIEIIRRQQEKEFEELKQEQEKNIEEEKIKKEDEQKREHVYEDVRKKLNLNGINEQELENIENINELDIEQIQNEIDQIINDVQNYRNPRIGRQIAGTNEEEKNKEQDKEQEIEIQIPIVDEELPVEELQEPELKEELQEELEEPTIEEELEDPELEEELEEELQEPELKEELQEELQEELEEPTIEEELEDPELEEELEDELQEPELKEELQEKLEEPTIEEELEDPELEEELEEELQEPELEEELEEKEITPPVDEEELLEEERRIGKEEFIKAVNEKISDDYKSLHNLEMENHRLTQELENVRDVGDVDKLLERIHENQNEIDNIIGRIHGIENGEIISVAYEFSKTKPKELKEFIKELESEPNNYRYVDELYKPYFKDNIDYIDRVTRLKNDTDSKEQEIQDTKDTFTNLDDKRNDNDMELERYNKRRFHFENMLLKYQVAINTLQSKVQNITVEEKKVTRYFLGNIEIKNSMQLKRIAMNMFNQPGNQKDLQQIYQELQSKLTIIENSKLVPSGNYRNMLLNEKNNLFNTGLELKGTISEIRAMKEEFKEEFSDYYDNEEYFSYLEQIEKMERKFVSQTDKISLLDTKIDQTILENDRKVAEIEQMNIGRDNVRVIQDPNNIQQQQQYYQQQQNPYYQGYNPYDNGEYQQDYEQERSRGRGR